MSLRKIVSKIEEVANKAVKNKLFPGVVIGVIDDEGNQLVLPFGKLSYDDDVHVVEKDTIYDIASITKCIPTSTLAIHALDNNLIKLEDLAVTFLPELSNSYARKITLKNLLTYTVGFDFRLSSFKDRPPEEIINLVMKSRLHDPPGARLNYSNTSILLLGILLERLYGDRLETLANRFIFGPLEMTRTSYHPEDFPADEIAPTEFDSWRGSVVRGVVHDESAYIVGQKVTPGWAGVFATVPDLLIFFSMIIGVGSGWKGIISEEAIKYFYTNQLADIGEEMALGWFIGSMLHAGSKISPRAFGKGGFTGCFCLCDLDKRTALVFLSNHIHPKRPSSPQLIRSFREQLADIVLS